jgi:hypothetical protein
VADEEVGIRLSLKDRRQTVSGIKDVNTQLDATGRKAQTAGRLARGSSAGFAAMGKAGRVAGKLIRVGFVAALGAGYAAVRLLKSSFAEAREAQRIGAVTEARIKSTGKAANLTAKQVGRLSLAIGKKTAIDDESIQSGANWLLTFKNIRNEQGKGNKIFSRALGIATDYAASLAGTNAGVSLKSASIAVGKALNDPVKGLTALAKAGVTFSEGQIERIKNFVAEGKLLKAQKIELRELQSEFGGTAKAQATMGDRVAFAWGNIQERLGTVLLPMLDRVERWFLKKGVPAIEKWVGVFEKKGIPAINRFVKKARPLAEEVLPALSSILGDVRDVLSDAAPYAVKLVRAFNGMPDWAKKGLAIGGLATFAASKTGVLGALTGSSKGSGVGGLIAGAKPVPVFVTNAGFGGTGTGGVPGVPTTGGKPGGTPVPGLFSLPGLALTGATIADQVIPAPPMGNAEDFLAKLKNPLEIAIDQLGRLGAAKADLENLLIKPLGIAETHTRSLGFELDTVGRMKPAPTFTTPGLEQSWGEVSGFDKSIRGVPKTWSTEFQVGIGTAMANINTVTTAAHNALAGLWGGGTPSPPRAPGVKPPERHQTPGGGNGGKPSAGLPSQRGRGGEVLRLEIDGRVLTEVALDHLRGIEARA